MTMPVYVKGITISDDGELVINADEMADAGVRSVELIEGEPPTEARITELEARLELRRKSEEGTLAQMAETNERFEGALSKIEELETQLAEAKRETATQARVAANLTNQAMEQLNRAEQAEARADALHKELNHWKSEFIREGSMPNSEINARIEAYSQRIEQAEARAADLAKELETIVKKTAPKGEGWYLSDCTHDQLLETILETNDIAQAALNPDARQE